MKLLEHLRDRLTPSVPISFVAAKAAADRVVGRAEFLRASPPVRLEVGERVEHSLKDTVVRDVSHGAAKILDHESYSSEPYTFVRLADARVHVRWGIVQDRPGRFIDESVHATRWLNQNVWQLPTLPTVGGGFLPGMTLSGRCATREPRTRLRDPHVLLGHWCSHNYGHFIMDCLPSAFIFRDELRSGKLSLLARPLLDWQRRLLARLDIPERAIHEVDEDLVTADDVIFPLSLTCSYTANPGPLHRELFAALGGEASNDAPERIYVSRASRAGSRVMLNETELAEGLAARGFTTVDPGELSVDEQVATFSRAKLVVGALGAGLTNIGFAPPGCAVVEILPDAVTETWIAHLTQVLGHRFAFIVAKTMERRKVAWGQRTDVEFDYETPLEPTLAAIDQLLA